MFFNITLSLIFHIGIDMKQNNHIFKNILFYLAHNYRLILFQISV